MAYQPIGQSSTKGGYVPIGQKPKKTLSGSMDTIFPRRQQVRSFSERSVAPQQKQAPKSYKEQTGLDLPFEATKTGIALNTIKGIPRSIKKVNDQSKELFKDIAQATARTVGTVGITAGNLPYQAIGAKKPFKSETNASRNSFGRALFGEETVKDLPTYGKAGSEFIKETTGLDVGTGPASTLPLAGLGIALDLSGMGGGSKKIIIKSLDNLIDSIKGVKTAQDGDVFLRNLGVPDKTIVKFKLGEKAAKAETDDAVMAIVVDLKNNGAVFTPTKVKPTGISPTLKPLAPVKTQQISTLTPTARPVTEVTKLPPVKQTPEVIEEVKTMLQQWMSGGNRRALTPVLTKVDDLNIKPAEPITLYRIGDIDDSQFQSWSKVKDSSSSVSKTFTPDEVLIDTTDPRFRELYTEKAQLDVVDQFNKIENEVIIKPSSMVQKSSQQSVPELSSLPKLPENVRQAIETGQADKTIGKAISERYSNSARKPVAADNELAAAAKSSKTPGEIKRITGELLTPISSRLERINPELKVALRKFENSVAQKTYTQSVEIKPLLDATKKMTKEDGALFDLAQKNGDSEVIDAMAIRYGIQDEVNKARAVMDDIFKRAEEVGMDISYRKDYFPRMIKNPQKFLAYLRGRADWSGIRAAVESHAAKKGVKYTDMTPEEIAGVVNNFIRGYGNKIELTNPNFAKGRTLEVLDSELNEFYESTNSALSTYVIRMNDEIEGRKFFGKRPKGAPVEDVGAQDSIGAYVFDLIEKGKIKPDQEDEVTNILRARFSRGKMNGALDVYRNAEYISTMGSVISAVTQIGDIAFSLFDNGIYHTGRGIKKSFSKNRVTKEDLGIEQITQEFSSQTKSGKALETVFKLTGLTKMDRLGKETLVNGNMSKLQSWAKKNDDRLDLELNRWFDAEEALVVKEQFRQGALTEQTKLVLFSRLLDFQPVAKSEMPQKYLEMPNGKIFYMLKSFTIKQIDVFRREAIDDIVSGDKKRSAKGMKNMLLLGGSFVLANASADEIKDQILGRDTPMEDRIVDNMWRLFGASKYDVYKARQEGFGTTVMKKVLFPASILDRGSKDVSNLLEEKVYEKGPLKGQRYKSESVQSIPIGGKLYYWWFGRGAQKEEYKEGVGTTTEGLPKLPKIPKVEGATGQLPKLPKI